LQSFDDDYRFFGNLTRKARWVTQDDQVGNAVPPLLAQAIARHLAKAGSLFGVESLAYAS
jgi:DNA (cytosine-5)-methyltransferase 1